MAFEIPADLNPALVPLAWLLGPWHGNGRGEYPGSDPFGYEEDVIFAHDGRAFLHYFSRTWLIDESGERGKPSHMETGFIRPGAEEGELEMVLAHPTGYAEVWYGTVDGPRITLQTDVIARTATAKEVTAGQRMYGLVEGKLMYAYDMAAVGQPIQPHLWGTLARA